MSTTNLAEKKIDCPYAYDHFTLHRTIIETAAMNMDAGTKCCLRYRKSAGRGYVART